MGVEGSAGGVRINPVLLVLEAAGLRTTEDYRHTRHRYPWVCSLRALGQTPRHLCAVTLLSLPPGPMVVVGAAHCTYLCKDSAGRILAPCCCHIDRPSSCTEDAVVCSRSPTVGDMAPRDVDILCGE